MFSFLTGKKDEKPEASAPVTAMPASVAAEPAPAAHVVTDAAHSAGDESTFSPPPAWNLDALTAPHPVQTGEVPQMGPTDAAATAEFQQKVIDVIKTVFDPEIPVDIYELGLIYEILVDADHRVLVRMTLTSPACPSAQQLPQEVRYKVKAIPGITEAWVEIVWEPPWDKERMSEAAKLTLGFF
jgi:FeS assembly SUF system protein